MTYDDMTCNHLREVEEAMIAKGIIEKFRGRAWAQDCREWVYFDCYIDIAAVRQMFKLDACVRDHSHRGTHDGSENGIECEKCKDGIMGMYERKKGVAAFPSPNLR